MMPSTVIQEGLQAPCTEFYALIVDWLRRKPFQSWLAGLLSDAAPSEPDFAFWEKHRNSHVLHLLKMPEPRASLGVLVALRLRQPHVFRFVFPFDEVAFRAQRAPFAPLHSIPPEQFPAAELVRHVHHQMNFSFGFWDLPPPKHDGIPAHDSLMRAAFEMDAVAYCPDVTALEADGAKKYLLSDGGDRRVFFRSIERAAELALGIRSILYLPCRYQADGAEAYGFCIAIYSPCPDAFGPTPELTAMLPVPPWLRRLRGDPLVRIMCETLLNCDAMVRATAREVFRAYYRNAAENAALAVKRLRAECESHGVPDTLADQFEAGLQRTFVHDSHVQISQFVSSLPELTTPLSLREVAAACSLALHEARDLAEKHSIRLSADWPSVGDLAGTQQGAETPAQSALRCLLRAFLNNAIQRRPTDGVVRLAYSKAQSPTPLWHAITVSNVVPYAQDVWPLLRRYWLVREGLAPPGPAPGYSGTRGIQLFLAVALARDASLPKPPAVIPEVLLDVPALGISEATWRAIAHIQVQE